MVVDVSASHNPGPSRSGKTRTIAATTTITAPAKGTRGVGIGSGLRPAPTPTHRILILIDALSHLDCRGTLAPSADDYIRMGGEDEATAYIQDNGAAWRAVPGAIEWLVARTAGLQPRHIGRKAR
jgi:hypothetical protein